MAAPAGAATTAVAPAPFMPSERATAALTAPKSNGRIALGVRTVSIDPATQARFKLPEPSGAYVIGVVADLPAAKAGVPAGSVIVGLGEQPVRSPVELTKLVTSGPLDRPVTVQFVLPGGESKRASVLLQPLEAALERVLADPEAATVASEGNPARQPRRAERPGSEPEIRPDVRAALRSEVLALRDRLDRLERLLESQSSRQR